MEMENKQEFQELVTAFQCYDTNGFGFKVVGRKNGTMTLAQVESNTDYLENKVLQAVLNETKPKTIKINDYLGKTFLSLDYLEWNYIPDIIQSILDKTDYNVCMFTRLNPLFKPKDAFSWAVMEERAIDRVVNYCVEKFETSPQMHTYKSLDEFKIMALEKFATVVIPEYDLDIWTSARNWTTKKGQAFCKLLKAAFPKEKEIKSFLEFENFNHETCKKYKVLHFGTWSLDLNLTTF